MKMKSFSLFFLFFISALLIRITLLPVMFTHYLGGASHDAGLYIWLSRVILEALAPNSWFTLPAFYPYQKSLAWSDNFILPSLLIQLLSWLSGSHIFSYNFCLLIALSLNGFCCFLLTRSIYCSTPAAIIAGIAFQSLSYFTSHLGHPQLQFSFFIPLSIYLYFKVEDTLSPYYSAGYGSMLAAAFLTSVYYFIFCLLLTGILILQSALCEKGKRVFSGASAIKLLFAGGIPLLLLIPFVIPYFQMSAAFGERHLYEAHQFAATPFSYFATGPFSFLYAFGSTLSHSEAWLFPGLLLLTAFFFRYYLLAKRFQKKLPLILFLALCPVLGAAVILNSDTLYIISGVCIWVILGLIFISFRSTDSREWVVLNVGLVFMVLSFGPLGSEVTSYPATSPYFLLFNAVPGVSAIRATGRLGIIFLCIACVAAGGLFKFISERTNSRGRMIAALSLVTFIFLEQWHHEIPLEVPVKRPPVFDTLQNRISETDAFFVFPQTEFLTPALQVSRWSDFAYHNMNVLNWSATFSGPALNGYSGVRNLIMTEYPRKLSGFPDERSVVALSLFPDLKYLVYMSSLKPGFERAIFLEKLSQFAPRFSVLEEDVDGNFLIDFSPVTRLTSVKESFLLRVPVKPSKVLSLELENREIDSVEVLLFIDGVYDENPYKKLELAATSRKTFNVLIPDVSNPVSPLIFRLISPLEKEVYLHGRSVSGP